MGGEGASSKKATTEIKSTAFVNVQSLRYDRGRQISIVVVEEGLVNEKTKCIVVQLIGKVTSNVVGVGWCVCRS